MRFETIYVHRRKEETKSVWRGIQDEENNIAALSLCRRASPRVAYRSPNRDEKLAMVAAARLGASTVCVSFSRSTGPFKGLTRL